MLPCKVSTHTVERQSIEKIHRLQLTENTKIFFLQAYTNNNNAHMTVSSETESLGVILAHALLLISIPRRPCQWQLLKAILRFNAQQWGYTWTQILGGFYYLEPEWTTHPLITEMHQHHCPLCGWALRRTHSIILTESGTGIQDGIPWLLLPLLWRQQSWSQGLREEPDVWAPHSQALERW